MTPIRRRGCARALGAGALVLVLSGCWPTPGQGPNRDAYNRSETALTAANVASLTEAWSAPLDGPRFQPRNTPGGQLVTGAGGVYASDATAAYRFDPTTGARDWTFPVPDFPEGQIVEMGQVLISRQYALVGYGSVGDWNGTGASWGTRVLNPATGQPGIGVTIPGGMPVAQRGDDLLLAANQCVEGSFCTATWSLVDIDTGATSRGTIGINIDSYAAPTLGSQRIYTTTFSVEPVTTSRVQAHPLEGNPASPLWTTDLGQFARAQSPVLSADQSTIYVGTHGAPEGHTVFALDAATGAIEWSTDVGGQVTDAVALAEGVLYVPTTTGLVAMSDTGSILWRGAASGSLGVQPAVAGGVVYTGAADGTVRAYDADGCGAATCDDLWSDATGDPIVAAPIVSGGRLYALSGTDNTAGRLVAYALP
jgi:outer membrane protein assembly factor BamB